MKKGVEWIYEFPIFDNDGDPVQDAAPVLYIAKDGGEYAAITNQATIAEKLLPDTTKTGTYKSVITATEMNSDFFVIIATTTATDAKQTPAFFVTDAYTITEIYNYIDEIYDYVDNFYDYVSTTVYNAITNITNIGGFTISSAAGDAVASVFDLVLEQGATYSRSFIWKDIYGAPVDITNWSFRMQIRYKPGKDGLIASSLGTIPTLIITKDAPYSGGQITITMSSANTAKLDFLHGMYDIEAYDAANPPIVYRIFQGCVTLSKEITIP